jgi:hypothetical protein
MTRIVLQVLGKAFTALATVLALIGSARAQYAYF